MPVADIPLVRDVSGQAGDGEKFEVDPRALRLIRSEVALRELVLPFAIQDDVAAGKRTVLVACRDADDVETRSLLRQQLGAQVGFTLFTVPIETLHRALRAAFPNESVGIGATTSLGVQLRDAAYALAMDRRASDIHIESHRDYDALGHDDYLGAVSINVDGHLHDVTETLVRQLLGKTGKISIPKRDLTALITSIKVAANMEDDFAMPASGGYTVKHSGRPFSLRIETWSSIDGPCMVLRVIDQSARPLRLHEIGMSAEMQAIVRESIAERSGLVLVNGQTENGKNFTAIAILLEVVTPDRSTQTLENPAELRIGHRVIQNEINVRAGRTWEVELESLMRRNPKNIYISETRSAATAAVMCEAVRAGQFGISTLHTTTCLQAIDRMTSPHLKLSRADVASVTKLLIAQRLVRRLCSCAKLAPTTEHQRDLMRRIGLQPLDEAMVAVGCDTCFGVGYHGRVGVFEVMPFTRGLAEIVGDQRRSSAEIEAYARANVGYKPMIYDGVRHIVEHTTSFDEVFAKVYGWRAEAEHHAAAEAAAIAAPVDRDLVGAAL
jgi:general secretion pathway protein E